jgi:hypothetical protein
LNGPAAESKISAMEHEEAQDQEVAEDLDLNDEQADAVRGGVTHSDIPITKPVDK